MLPLTDLPPGRIPLLACALLTFSLLDVSAQRLFLPPTPDATTTNAATTPPAKLTYDSLSSSATESTQILKVYPDGTKKIVPLSALNFRDDGAEYGGRPTLSLYSTPPTFPKSFSPERLYVAPIGTTDATATLPTAPPSSPDPTTSKVSTAAGDPMGGTASVDAMGGGAPVDPLSGSPSANAAVPPLQTVSGRPAPVNSAETTIELGTYDDFFMNAAVGGSIQGQLTARRVYNGHNMQAYPYTYPNGRNVTAENFTFQPGFRFDVEFGYNIYDWLGVSLQSGVIYNGINQYTYTLANGNSFHNSADGELVQVPVQVDAILRWPGATAFKPFIGGGIGAIWQQLDVNNYYFGHETIQANYCRSAFQFGFNGQLGANYTVSPGLDFYGVFKLLGAFTPRIGNYDFENSYNFALEVGIQSRF